MGFVMRNRRRSNGRRPVQYRPNVSSLEKRELLAIDLANVAGPPQTTAGPFGVQEIGLNVQNGAGFSVAEVGDVNNDGFDDFLIGAPTINPLSSFPDLGIGTNSAAFLVFGSRSITGVQDFLSLLANQRTGDLSQLGQPNQTNPVTGATGPSFDGLVFVATQNPNSQIGASVSAAGDVNGDNIPDFLIGAPNALDATGANQGVGRAYLVYGSTNLVRTTKTVDFDNATSFTGLNVVTFVNTLGNAQTGTSVAAAGTVLSSQTNSVAIGAPGASLNGQAQNGAVYIVSGETGGALRPASTRVVNLAFLGQGGTTNIPGVILSGASSGDAAGYSLADAGNVDATPGDELLIGAIQANIGTLTATGPGIAYLVYGGNLASFAVVLNGINQITLSRIGSTATNGVPGASFAGAAVGDLTGYAVSPAGDFNADGLADFLIGSPGFTSAAGRASLIFGRAATPNPPGRINGSFQLSSLPVDVPFVEFDGPLPGTLAGWAVTAVLDLNGDFINEIAIGAPGFNAGQGVVYLIPGNPDLAGVQNLGNNEGPAIQGLNINLSSPPGAHFLGSSVSGRLAVNSSGRTVDGDNLGDLIVGAAGYSLNSARTQAGTGFALEGAFLAPFLPPPVSNAITSDIGVNSVFPPFTVSVSAPVDLPLFILSGGSNTPGFTPPTDLNPNTIRVNGIPLPDPGTFENAGDLDGDGIDDATFIFSPISLLGLTPGNVTFIIQAQTSASGQFPNRRYTGTALVRVTGVPPEPTPSVPITQDAFLDDPNAARPPFGERFLPQAFVLSRFRWRALPSETAYRQFRPNRFFGSRLRFASHPNKAPKVTKYNSLTLKNDVFSRGRFKPGLAVGRFRHKQAVIPLQNI